MTEAGDATDDRGISARYEETGTERVLRFSTDDREATIVQNLEGYAMLKVRGPEGDERERYYEFDVALDHAAELLAVDQHDLPIPEDAEDMGM